MAGKGETGILTLYSDVQATSVRWLWYPFIAVGKITLLQGDPGDGKSTMMMNLIAELSKGGNTPDGNPIGMPKKVIYQCSEDGVSDTIKPRLEKCGADCRNVAFINEDTYSGLTLDDERIRQAIIEFRPRLVVIDPIQAYLGSDSDLQIAGRARKLMHRLGMPAAPVMVKTIVTMDMGEQIATHYGLRTINVLTGFKFIGEQIGKLEQQSKADSYVFGFEESYGYLTGSYVRDKDGVDGAYMICEMFSYYATQGISLLDKLNELYKTYGYCLNTLHSYEFDGSAGFAKMQSIMQAFRGGIKEFGGKKVVKLLDYAPGLDGLPKSDVLKFLLEDNCSIVVRPSGTEPKLKTYISVSAEDKEAAEKVEAEICKSAEEFLK